MNKQVLRDLYLEKRLTLTHKEYQKRNQIVYENAIAFLKNNNELRHCHLFMTIEEKKEVNTQFLFDWLLASTPHQVYLPKVTGKGTMSHHQMTSESELRLSKWGILEPLDILEVDPAIFDIVFVPLICFDSTGQRIGYGAGFYDRFLTKTKKNCLKVGLSISPPLDNIDYSDQFDIPLDLCISHLGVRKF